MKALTPEEVEAIHEASRAVIVEAVRLCEQAARVIRETEAAMRHAA